MSRPYYMDPWDYDLDFNEFFEGYDGTDLGKLDRTAEELHAEPEHIIDALMNQFLAIAKKEGAPDRAKGWAFLEMSKRHRQRIGLELPSGYDAQDGSRDASSTDPVPTLDAAWHRPAPHDGQAYAGRCRFLAGKLEMTDAAWQTLLEMMEDGDVHDVSAAARLLQAHIMLSSESLPDATDRLTAAHSEIKDPVGYVMALARACGFDDAGEAVEAAARTYRLSRTSGADYSVETECRMDGKTRKAFASIAEDLGADGIDVLRLVLAAYKYRWSPGGPVPCGQPGEGLRGIDLLMDMAAARGGPEAMAPIMEEAVATFMLLRNG